MGLDLIHEALGWQGGTAHQAAAAVRRLRGQRDALLAAVEALFPADCWARYDLARLADPVTVELTCNRAEVVALRAAIGAAREAP